MPGAQSSTRTLVPKETRTILGFRAYFREKARPRARPSVSPTATPKLRTASSTDYARCAQQHSDSGSEGDSDHPSIPSFLPRKSPATRGIKRGHERALWHTTLKFSLLQRGSTCYVFFPFDVLAVLSIESKQIITRIVINFVVTKFVVIK